MRTRKRLAWPSSWTPPPARRRPSIASYAAVGLLAFLVATGNGCGSSGPWRVEFDGREYFAGGEIAVDDADLREIGSAEVVEAAVVSDPTVLAVTGLDPAIAILLRADRGSDTSEGDHPRMSPLPFVVFVSDLGAFPDLLCRYYEDRRSEATPPECQAEVTVTFEGRTYRAVGWAKVATDDQSSTNWAAFSLHFLPWDLVALGPLDDLDPRLAAYDLPPIGYAITGVDPSDAIAVVRTMGVMLDPVVVLIRESLDGPPLELCAYLRPDFGDTATEFPSGCQVPNPADMEAVDQARRNEERWIEGGHTAYSYTVEVRCSCPDADLGPITIVVGPEDGHGRTSAVTAGGVALGTDETGLPWTPLTVEAMFGFVGRFAGVERLVVEVEYDSATGHPVSLNVDAAPGRLGGEYGFTITGFTTDG